MYIPQARKKVNKPFYSSLELRSPSGLVNAFCQIVRAAS